MPRSARLFGGVLVGLAGAVVSVGVPASALGQGGSASSTAATTAPAVAGASWLNKASDTTKATPGTESADALLFGPLSAVETAPAGAGSIDAASLLGPKSPDWARAKAWAEGAAQVKALEALTAATDTKKKYLITLPYGSAGVDAAWVKAGIVVELPKDSMLAGARYRYLGALERLFALASVDATRLAESGKGDKALARCVEWVRLAKMVAERESVTERVWAMRQMILATERMRDIAYAFRDAMSPEVCRNASDELDERLVQVRRLSIPSVERFAAEQLIEATIAEKGAVNPGKFAATMARLKAGERSLSNFGAAAWYRELAAGHAGWFDTKDQLAKVYGGWTNRWAIQNLHDDLLQIPSDYAKMDKAKFALIDAATRDIEQMQALRLELMTSLAGTRVSLGVVGYERKEKRWPPNVSAIAPNYVRVLDPDPYGYDKRFKNLNAFHFKVPIRDDPKREREEPRPHEMMVGVGTASVSAPSQTPEMLEAMSKAAADRVAADPEAAELAMRLVAISAAVGMAGANGHELTESALSSPAAFLEWAKEEYRLISKQRDTKEAWASIAQSMNADLKGKGLDGSAFGNARAAKISELTMLPDAEGKLGIDFAAMRDATAELIRLRCSHPKMDAAFRAADTGTLTPELLREAELESQAQLVGAQQFSAIAEQLHKAYTGPMGARLQSLHGVKPTGDQSASAAGFRVTLTQKDFLLWSVGPDATDDQAKSVGSGGSDVLIWPPILSLRREHAGH